MRSSWLVRWLTIVICLSLPGQAAAQKKESRGEELNLAVGENKTVPAGDVRNYSEGAPGIADVRLTTDGTQFVVVGQKPGTTTLLLIKKDGSQVSWLINVYTRPMETV